VSDRKFNSSGLHHQISFGYSPAQLASLLKDFRVEFSRAVDVGSGTAMHSIAMAQYSPLSTVYSIEPDFQMHEHAHRNRREAKSPNLLLHNEDLSSFLKRNAQGFDLVHSCMVSYFSDSDLSTFVRSLSLLVNNMSTLIFTDFVRAQFEDRKLKEVSDVLFSRMFPSLRNANVKDTATVVEVFERNGWDLNEHFNIHERYPGQNSAFNQALPKQESERRNAIMLEIQNEFFLMESPKLMLSRTFVFRKGRSAL
jgi:cyclopropane fatty-acyl-phospholipid synthase-like methyltransferase